MYKVIAKSTKYPQIGEWEEIFNNYFDAVSFAKSQKGTIYNNVKVIDTKTNGVIGAY